MDCKFAEKVSLLIDGELPAEETERVKAHVAGCAVCRQLESDFLYLRRQIKESLPEPTRLPEVARLADRRPVRRKAPFWKRRIPLPAPVFVLLVIALAAFVVRTITANLGRTGEVTTPVQDAAKKTMPDGQPPPPLPPNTQGEISLSRFDKGGRAEIYTIHRQIEPESEKQRSLKQ